MSFSKRVLGMPPGAPLRSLKAKREKDLHKSHINGHKSTTKRLDSVHGLLAQGRLPQGKEGGQALPNPVRAQGHQALQVDSVNSRLKPTSKGVKLSL